MINFIRKIYTAYNEGGIIMQTKKILCYIVGSLVVFGIACLVVPKITKCITNKMYKDSVKKKNEEDDDEDWGPELVKKTDDK